MLRRLVLLVFLATALACAAKGPAEHIVMFGENGTPRDPSDPPILRWFSDYAPVSDEPGRDVSPRARTAAPAAGHRCRPDPAPATEWDAYLDNLFAGVCEHFTSPQTQPRRVVVFIHGGLNTVQAAIERARDMTPLIEADGAHGAYPIFINWRSNLYSSYNTHIFRVRQGDTLFGADNDAGDNVWDGFQFLFFPLVFAADVARGVIRFPFVAVHQLQEATEWLGWGDSPERERADDAAEVFVAEARANPEALQVEAHVSKGDLSFGTGTEATLGFVRWLVFIPAKVVTTLIVDVAGTGSWSVMRRRVNLLFERPGDEEDLYAPDRGLRVFLRRLAKAQHEHGFEIDVVGHSMGAIVVNRILREGYEAEEQRGKLSARSAYEAGAVPRIDHITYLAAACSVGDYESSAFPYLNRQREARVHHVTLHPDNEIGEAPAYDLAPRGSLLTWIDDFLATPLTPRDRTAGRSTNLLAALQHTPDDLRSRISVRVLPWNDDELPQTHGGFDDLSERWHFWRRADWQPDPEASDT